MTQWDVARIPLKPDLDKVPASLKAGFEACNDRMEDFFPKGLHPSNIGSNEGLAKVVRELYVERKMNDSSCKQYSAVTVDVNIFDRMMKVTNVMIGCT